ncbi:MAG: hypothetical protein IKC11_04730 [Clostridia bacterium]|nr:hypothetical protein [Clostridia bacterium]
MSFDFFTLQALKKLNDEKRNAILEQASVIEGEFDKMAFIVKKFLSEYKFDYSVLKSPNEFLDRRPYLMPFEYGGKRFHCASMRAQDPDMKHKIPMTPSLHSLNMGTCFSFSTELEWFAKEFGIKNKKVNRVVTCYDGYQTVRPENEIREMLHYYMVMNLDGEDYKIDVAGALMAMDYKKKHPEADISAKDFVFVDPNKENPFDKIALQNKQKGEE